MELSTKIEKLRSQEDLEAAQKLRIVSQFWLDGAKLRRLVKDIAKLDKLVNLRTDRDLRMAL